MNNFASKDYLDTAHIKITETNSECESDEEDIRNNKYVKALEEKVKEKEVMAREAIASYEAFKKINQNLLNAMTQMSLEKNKGLEAVLHKEMLHQNQKYNRNLEETRRNYQMKFESLVNKCRGLEKNNEELYKELDRSRNQNYEQSNQIAALRKTVEQYKGELAEYQFMKGLQREYQMVDQEKTLESTRQQLEDSRETIERIRNQLNTVRQQRQSEQKRYEQNLKRCIDHEKKIFQANLESALFEKRVLKKEVDNIKKEYVNLEKRIEEMQLSNVKERQQENNKWVDINEKLIKRLALEEEIVAKKQNEAKQHRKQCQNLKNLNQRLKVNMLEVEKKNKALEGLLSEAKFHLVNMDLQRKDLQSRNRNEQKHLKEENEKLRQQFKVVKQSEERRSKVLEQLLEYDSKILQGSKSKQQRGSSISSNVDLDRSKLKANHENNMNIANLKGVQFEFSESKQLKSHPNHKLNDSKGLKKCKDSLSTISKNKKSSSCNSSVNEPFKKDRTNINTFR